MSWLEDGVGSTSSDASHLPSTLAVPVQRPLEEDSLLGMTLRWPRVGMLLWALPGTPVPLVCHLRCFYPGRVGRAGDWHEAVCLVLSGRVKPRCIGQWPGRGWSLEPGCGLDAGQGG